MTKGFITKMEFLDETIETENCLHITDSLDQLKETVLRENLSMIGIIGEFGVGKSTLIKQLEKSITEKTLWVHFDAWQFPERKQLWDGLILTVANTINCNSSTVKAIDKGRLSTIIDNLGTFTTVIDGALKYNSLPGITRKLVDLYKYFSNNIPATRVFQLQEIFIEILKKIKEKSIIIVTEDIDRSDKEGIFFLQTLRNFLNLEQVKAVKKNITILVPISNKSFESDKDAYIKCLDHAEFLHKKDLVIENILKMFDETIFTNQALLQYFLTELYKQDGINFRTLKFIIRQANEMYMSLIQKKYEPNPIICLAIISLHYLKTSKDAPYINCFDHCMQLQRIEPIVKEDFICITLLRTYYYKTEVIKPIHIKHDSKEKDVYKKEIKFNEFQYCISSCYFNQL